MFLITTCIYTLVVMLLAYSHFYFFFWLCSYILVVLLLGSITNPKFDVHVSFLII